MHIHILGICGTFMGSLALLARDLGHTVTGSDQNIYPPMSTQLEASGIDIYKGYHASHLGADGQYCPPDLVVVGNAMGRGIEAVEYMLDNDLPYTSGPQFLAQQLLQSRHVLAVAGTHGKTTTTTMLAWVLQYNQIDTGFLIGGVPIVQGDDKRLNDIFTHSSHLGTHSTADKKGYFVIEADEYDSAFFDKRSKFIHYHPNTAILNNLEFDHADIFADLNAIQTQFHHMIRIIPATGQIIMPSNVASLEETIAKGCWTPIWQTAIVKQDEDMDAQVPWCVKLLTEDGSRFQVRYVDDHGDVHEGEVNWTMSGEHNVNNGLMAICAAVSVGVSVADGCKALSHFAGIKRRMELIGKVNDITVYDDFAHHPTAITTTLDGASKKFSDSKLWAIIEPRSNTMKMGIHQQSLAISAEIADHVLWYEPKGLEWGLSDTINNATVHNAQQVFSSTDAIIEHITDNAQSGDTVVIMSNGGFEGIHQRLLTALNELS